MLASTDTAHVVSPYTNASGKYVAIKQHPLSTLRAHGRTRRLKAVGGGDGDEDLEGAMEGAPGGWKCFFVFFIAVCRALSS